MRRVERRGCDAVFVPRASTVPGVPGMGSRGREEAERLDPPTGPEPDDVVVMDEERRALRVAGTGRVPWLPLDPGGA